MKRIYTLGFIAFFCASGFAAGAKTTADSVKVRKPKQPVRRSYIASGMDAAIFSTSTIDNSAINSNPRLRFSYILNWGFTFNLNLSRHIGVYTGIDIKNIGFIEEVSGIITKRRTYNIGAPVGIKIGNMADRKCYGFLGGGADIPVNYREKSFSARNQKTKFNEWFSERTPQVMPYVFAGFAFQKGLTLKVQYYPNNFLNPDFTKNGAKPYANYDVHLQTLSLAISVPVKRRKGTMRMIGDKKPGTTTEVKAG